MQFDLFDLLNYVYAEGDLLELDEEYQANRLEVLDGLFPQYEVVGGKLHVVQVDTELAGIELATMAIIRDKKADKLKHKANKLKKAMTLLNDDEVKVFKAKIQGKQCDLPYHEYLRLYDQAVIKLCEYLEQEKEKELQSIEEQRKAEIKAYREENKQLSGVMK